MQPLPNLYSLLLVGNIWTLQSVLFVTETMKGNKAQKASLSFTKALDNYQITCFLALKRKLFPTVRTDSIFTEVFTQWFI